MKNGARRQIDPHRMHEARIGPYRLEGLLGWGAMSEVFRGFHTGLHRYEAVKVLAPQVAAHGDVVARFLSEARLAARLQHPNIATIYTVGDAKGPDFFYGMELVEGEDLSALLARRGRLGMDEALPILEQIASALDYAHSKRVIHRDVKPSNILLKEEPGQPPVVKVADFGIARALQEAEGTRLTSAGAILGTPEYISPEQAGAGPRVDHRTDIYSLAVVAYEMLCGRPPFVKAPDALPISVLLHQVKDAPVPPAERVPGLPVPVSDAILKALAKDPEDRYPTCGAFVAALRDAATRRDVATQPEPISTPDPEPVPEPAPVVREVRTVEFTLVLAALMLVALVGVAAYLVGAQSAHIRQAVAGKARLPALAPAPKVAPKPIPKPVPKPAPEPAPKPAGAITVREVPHPSGRLRIQETPPARPRPAQVQPLVRPPVQPDETPAAPDAAAAASVLRRYERTLERGDLDSHMNLYAPVVRQWFRRRNVPAGEIRDLKRREWAGFSDARVNFRDIRVQPEGPNRMRVTFLKSWDLGGRRRWTGLLHGTMEMEMAGRGWKIVSERDGNVVWQRHEERNPSR